MKNSSLSLSPEELEQQERVIVLGKTRRQAHSQMVIIDNVFWAVWVGVIPVPVIDFIFVTAVQLKMINALSVEYNVKFSKNRAKAIITALLAGITVSAVTKSNLLKMIPGIGSLSGPVSMAIFAGATTYAIGKVFERHFESGGNLLNLEPLKFKNYFANQYAEGQKLAARQAVQAK